MDSAAVHRLRRLRRRVQERLGGAVHRGQGHHLALLPQGQPEQRPRVRAMVDRMDAEGFGACSNEGECEATCPKGISIAGIARMNRQYARAVLRGAGEKKAAGSGD